MSLLTPAVAFGAALVLFVWVAVGAWVTFDAHARGSDHLGLWGVLAPVSGIVLAYYLLWWRPERSRWHGGSEPPLSSSSPASWGWSSGASSRRPIRPHS